MLFVISQYFRPSFHQTQNKAVDKKRPETSQVIRAYVVEENRPTTCPTPKVKCDYVSPNVDRCCICDSSVSPSSSLSPSSSFFDMLLEIPANRLSELFQFGSFSVFSAKTNLFIRFITRLTGKSIQTIAEIRRQKLTNARNFE